MPRTETSDGGHTAFTDHRIRRPGVPKVLLERSEELRAWRPLPDAGARARGLGLAYAGAGRLEQAYDLLRTVERPDAAVQDALGLIYLRAERPALAVAALAAAVKEDPKNSVRRLNLAAAYLAAGDREKARAEAMAAIALEPLLEDAYALLAEIEPRRAEYWRAEFTKRLR
jgi:predicted Zn-dependent protease